KMGSDVRGDPTSALLEVLDPAQNSTFVDHYLEVPFDLSSVMFIATANSIMPIPDPLLDRMEQLTLVGYTPSEKLQIAKRYLLPRCRRDRGCSPPPCGPRGRPRQLAGRTGPAARASPMVHRRSRGPRRRRGLSRRGAPARGRRADLASGRPRRRERPWPLP